MNPESKNERIRRCATCGKIHGADTTNPYCRKCGGPMVRLGPIEWSEKDEHEANIDLLSDYKNGDDLNLYEDEEEIDLDIDLAKAFELDDKEFQDVVCLLWDEIEASDDLIDEKDEEVTGSSAVSHHREPKA